MEGCGAWLAQAVRWYHIPGRMLHLPQRTGLYCCCLHLCSGAHLYLLFVAAWCSECPCVLGGLCGCMRPCSAVYGTLLLGVALLAVCGCVWFCGAWGVGGSAWVCVCLCQSAPHCAHIMVPRKTTAVWWTTTGPGLELPAFLGLCVLSNTCTLCARGARRTAGVGTYDENVGRLDAGMPLILRPLLYTEGLSSWKVKWRCLASALAEALALVPANSVVAA